MRPAPQSTRICIAVLAHNEEARIAKCLRSLPLGTAGVDVHVLVNGSSDNTAGLARAIAGGHEGVSVHDWQPGGKSRSWNRFVFEVIDQFSDVHIFVDGDSEIADGAIGALANCLVANPEANAVSAPPLNGRKASYYRARMIAERGLFGDLYALRGGFLSRMKSASVRLPEDLVGDDGLLASLAKTDLENESEWQANRLVVCEDAGFYCAPLRFSDASSWQGQYSRMISYSKRHFQNLIISDIMRAAGPAGLPEYLSSLYPRYLPTFEPRSGIVGYFDRLALQRMRQEIAPLTAAG